MLYNFAVSPHPRDNFVLHHSEIVKNTRGIRGSVSDPALQKPTAAGQHDLDRIIGRLADYATELWHADPGKDVAGPLIAIVAPDGARHCQSMADFVAKGLKRTPGLRVTRHNFGELDGVKAPWLEQPIHNDKTRRDAVDRFIKHFDMWEAGERRAMPDPRTVGGTMSPRDYVRRAEVGQRLVAGLREPRVAVQFLTSSGVALANAVYGPDAEKALATGVFPAARTPHGYADVYHFPAWEGQPIKMTAEPIKLSTLVPHQIMPELELPFDPTNMQLV